MSDPLRQLLQGLALEETRYPTGSRYHRVPIGTVVLPDGRLVRYLRRRRMPDPQVLAAIAEHRVGDGDRMDNLAARYLGDPLQAWRIADANGALRLEELVEEVGRRIRITLPEGVRDVSDD